MLKDKLSEGFILAPGIYDALTGLIAAKAGAEAIYLSGASIAYTRFGRSDIGLVSVSEVHDTLAAITDRIDIPVIVDADTGFGNALNVQRTVRQFERVGASAIQLEDQSFPKRCGHLAGKTLVSKNEMVGKIKASLDARKNENTLIIARTDALAANLITSDVDETDASFVLGERTTEGFFKVKNGPEAAISRGLSYAPYADLVWCETGTPDIGYAKDFADAIREKYPDKLLAYNCSPSFNWKKSLSDNEIETFQEQLSSFGYKFQFITLAGFHALNTSMFELASKYKGGNMSAYVELQQKEFAMEKDGFTSVKHQREVGAGYFDTVSTIISEGDASTLALTGSTEEEQF